LRAEAAAYGYSNEGEEIGVFVSDSRKRKKAAKKAVDW
jgi:hypothetical protein